MKLLQPKFPEIFRGAEYVWGQGNDLVSLPILARFFIGSSKEDEDRYWEEQDKKYNEIKSCYEQNCFVGTVWRGNTDVSVKITKIVITEEKAYICYKASDEYLAKLEIENQNRGEYKLLPPKPSKMSLHGFLSAIIGKSIQIVSVPILLEKNKELLNKKLLQTIKI
jgi:hypothetical protein